MDEVSPVVDGDIAPPFEGAGFPPLNGWILPPRVVGMKFPLLIILELFIPFVFVAFNLPFPVDPFPLTPFSGDVEVGNVSI